MAVSHKGDFEFDQAFGSQDRQPALAVSAD